MKYNSSNPALFNKKAICFEAREARENKKLNLLAKEILKQIVKEKQTGILFVGKDIDNIIYQRTK